jgi:hypothetical protein
MVLAHTKTAKTPTIVGPDMVVYRWNRALGCLPSKRRRHMAPKRILGTWDFELGLLNVDVGPLDLVDPWFGMLDWTGLN